MKTVTVRLNSEEQRFFEEFSKYKNIPISTLFKEALNEMIDNETDLRAILTYEAKLKNNEVEYISFEEIKRSIGM